MTYNFGPGKTTLNTLTQINISMTIKSGLLFSLIIIAVGLIGTFLLPFEWMVFLLFVVGCLTEIKKSKIFLLGLLIPLLLWIFIVLYRDFQFERSVSQLVGDILGNISPFITLLIVGLTIGLVSGFSAISGNLIRSVIVKKDIQNDHNA